MKMRILLILPTLILLQFSLTAQHCWVQVWADEFGGTAIDANNWSYETGNGCPGLCGWGNNEKEYYTNSSQNINVSGGYLNITAKYSSNYNGSGSDFTSGKIVSRNKQDWKYGKFEANVKLPAGLGLWPAVWLLPSNNEYGGWPTSGEIDIMEYRGDQTNKVDGTLHYGNGWPNNLHDGNPYTLPSGNFTSAFHLFAVEWEPGEIRWYVDGNLYKTETQSPNTLDPASNNAVNWPWDKDFFMILNLAVGGWYTGDPSTASIINGNTSWARTMQVDYVRVYSDLSGGAFDDPISGNTSILKNQSGSNYTISSNAGATYAWNVTGGTIASGQGTNSISVNWGASNGSVGLTKTLTCGSANFSLNTTLQPTHCGTTIEDFENNRPSGYGYIHGQFTQNVANPGASTENNSPTCARYVRNPAEQYDVLVLNKTDLGDANLFKNGIKRFAMDVYSNTSGRVVEITLETSTAFSNNYPTGRHTTYRATTTKVNQWETLYFSRVGIPDAGATATDIQRLVLFFVPGTATNATFYWDNLITDHQPLTSSITGSGSFCNFETKAYSVTNTSGSTYNWALPPGASFSGASTGNSVNVVFGNTNGTIEVTETNTAGCTTATAKTISVNSTGSCTTDLVDENSSNVQISPNPTQEKLLIRLKNMNSASWKITDVQGKECMSGILTGTTELNVSSLPEGLYLLTLEENGIRYVEKIMKE